jgi:hypothetical protein
MGTCSNDTRLRVSITADGSPCKKSFRRSLRNRKGACICFFHIFFDQLNLARAWQGGGRKKKETPRKEVVQAHRPIGGNFTVDPQTRLSNRRFCFLPLPLINRNASAHKTLLQPPQEWLTTNIQDDWPTLGEPELTTQSFSHSSPLACAAESQCTVTTRGHRCRRWARWHRRCREPPRGHPAW